MKQTDIDKLINAMKSVFASKDELDKTKLEILAKTYQNTSTIVDEKITQAFQDAFKLIPSKEEFFSRMDKLSGLLDTEDKERTIQAGKLSEHSDTLEQLDQRISVLEKRHSSNPSPVFPAM